MKHLLGTLLTVFTLSVAGGFVMQSAPAHVHAAPTQAVSRCYVGQLTAKVVASSGAAGHLGVMFGLHNRSRRTCTLYGFPGAQLLTARKSRLPTHLQWGDGYITGIQRKKTLVRLTPGANAYFVMEWTHIPSPGQRCPMAPLVRITPPNDYSSILVPMKPSGIDACGGILDVTPVSATRFPL